MSFSSRIKLIFISICMLTPLALAQENVISSVSISNLKNTDGYELSIDSSEVVNYKAKVTDENSIVFELKNSVLAQDAATYYDDVTGVDSVAVKQEGNNKVSIFVQGQNAQNTELVFENSAIMSSQANKKVVINHPINQYQSTNHADLENIDGFQDWDDNSFNLAHLSGNLLTSLKESSSGIILLFISILIVIGTAIKLVSSKFNQENEPLIGLNKSNGLTNDYNVPTRIVDKELPNIEKRSEMIRNAQTELAVAHQKYQEYIKNKYKNNVKEKINIDPIKKGFALNQYQKSSQNPYKNQQVLKMNSINKDFTQKVYQNDDFKIPTRLKKQTNENFSSPYIKKPQSAVNYVPQNKKANSMKFLESVTKIYEQSGRGDLANGLKNSMSRLK